MVHDTSLDIPSICIRAATPIQSPSTDSSSSSSPTTVKIMDYREPADSKVLVSTMEGQVRDSSPEIDPEPFTVELHIDEDRLMHELAIEEALEQGRVAMAEGDSEEDALQKVGVALAEKALREAMVQAALMEGRGSSDSSSIKENDDESSTSSRSSEGHIPLPTPPLIHIQSDSSSDVNHSGADEPADSLYMLEHSKGMANPNKYNPSFSDFEISSDEDHHFEGGFDVSEMSRMLADEANANPFGVPRSGEEYDPSALEHDISSEEDGHYEGGMDALEMSRALAAEASANPFGMPRSTEEYDPSIPEHDISSDENDHYEGGMSALEMSMALAEEAQSYPFSVPWRGADYTPVHGHDHSECDDYEDVDDPQAQTMKSFPISQSNDGTDLSIPMHEISSEEDETRLDGDVDELSRMLADEARANPFSVPRSGEEYLPAVPEPDVSSEDEGECSGVARPSAIRHSAGKPYSSAMVMSCVLPAPHVISSDSDTGEMEIEDHHHAAAHILQTSVLANPYSVPLTSHYRPPVVIDSSEDSDDERESDDDLPDAADILESDLLANPYTDRRFPEADKDFPPLPPFPLPKYPVPKLQRQDYRVIGDSSDSDSDTERGAHTSLRDDGDQLEALEQLDAPGWVHSSSEEDTETLPSLRSAEINLPQLTALPQTEVFHSRHPHLRDDSDS